MNPLSSQVNFNQSDQQITKDETQPATETASSMSDHNFCFFSKKSTVDHCHM